ncbi:MAG: hypothetical protein IKL57_00110 [Oscillospiraceae bacterium]|nr:hypothetical protein [Oscillospiraceae bacterium]
MAKTAYLFGEIHGSEIVNLKEFEIWQDFYNRGVHDLFMELPYFYTGFLNLWMKSQNDDFFDLLFEDKTSGNSEFDKNFFRLIKEKCPKTVFHGTDIGHSFDTVGKRYIEALFSDSEEYRKALENIEQGRIFYEYLRNSEGTEYSDADNIREKALAENFIREFDSVEGDIVGIYGEAHVFSEGTGNFGIKSNMCERIKTHYGDRILIDSKLLKNLISPISRSEIMIHGKNYESSYFGKIFTPFDESCDYIEIYRIENPGNDFEKYERFENFIPEALYPCTLNKNDVFLIYSIKNGEYVQKQLFVCDDFSEEYGFITTEINIEL